MNFPTDFEHYIQIEINAIVDSDQPGFARCTFKDAYGKVHKIIEKIPVLTHKEINKYCKFPVLEKIPVVILAESKTITGEETFIIQFIKSYGIQTTEDLIEFAIFKTNLLN